MRLSSLLFLVLASMAHAEGPAPVGKGTRPPARPAKPVIPTAPGASTAAAAPTEGSPGRTAAATGTSSQNRPTSLRKEEIRKTLEKRKARAAMKARSRAATRAEMTKQAEWQREYQLKMAPFLEAQRQQQARLAIEASQAQALDRLGAAAEQEAATNRARYRLQTQQAGVPQIFIPGEGLVPYQGGIASPYPYIPPYRP